MWPKRVAVDIATIYVVLVDCVLVLFEVCLVSTRKTEYSNKLSELLYIKLLYIELYIELLCIELLYIELNIELYVELDIEFLYIELLYIELLFIELK